MAESERLIVLGPDEGLRVAWLEGVVRLVVLGEQTGGAYTAEVGGCASGTGPKPHSHGFEESFYVLEGGPVRFTAGNREVSLGAGGFVNIGGGTGHHFMNEGAGARLLTFCAPAGFDRFQREAGVPFEGGGRPEVDPKEIVARIERIAPGYGIDMHPDEALFRREPSLRAVPPGEGEAEELAEGVTARRLAGPEHTDGRYAMASLRFAPGASAGGELAAVERRGLFVLRGRLAVEAGGRAFDAGPEASVHLPAGTGCAIRNEGGEEAEALFWVVPEEV